MLFVVANTHQSSNEMTMEEFIKKYKNDCRYYFDGYYSDCIEDFLTNIYNDHEALQQPKSCAKCKAFKLDDEHNDGFGQCFWGIHFPNGNSSSYHKGTDFYCSEFEAKEQ